MESMGTESTMESIMVIMVKDNWLWIRKDDNLICTQSGKKPGKSILILFYWICYV